MKIKSVHSIHPCQSVIQTIYDIVKAHGGVPMAPDSYQNGMKMETKENKGTEFVIQLPIA